MRSALRLSSGLLAMLIVSTVQGKTFFVDVGESIQDAVDDAAARPGPDQVKIAAGGFTENVVVKDDDHVTIRGAGAGSTVISNAAAPVEHVIDIESGDVTIRSLTVTGGDDGIRAEGNSLTLLHVDASGNEDDGVDARDIGRVRVIGGTFNDNLDGDGIKVENADRVDIVGAQFSGQLDGDGLDFEEVDRISLVHVDASGNQDEGLEVDDADWVSVVGGKFLNNGDDGIDTDSATAVSLVGVRSSGNGFEPPDMDGNGFQVEAENRDTALVVVLASRFSGNAADGIKTANEGSFVRKVVLTAVTASDNVESGLDITADEARLRAVRSGTGQGNGEDDVLP